MSQLHSRNTSAVAVVACIAGLILFLYFGFFAAVMVDERVLGTFFFAKISPPWVQEIARIVYWPLIAPLENWP